MVLGKAVELFFFFLSSAAGQVLLQTQSLRDRTHSNRQLHGTGTFESSRPGSCCSLSPHTFITWSEFRNSTSFAENISRDLPPVVPCGFEVTINENISQLPGLQVVGSLRFQDGADITLRTAFIFVCGKFSIGSPAGPHKAKVDIVLTGITEVTWPMPDGTTKSFGTTGFITYGGYTYIHGSSCDAPAWSRLAKKAAPPQGEEGNLALHKSAKQSSLGHHRYTAEKAVDGKVDWKGSSILTQKEQNPWWYVHIPSLSRVGTVTVSERPHRGMDLASAIVGITASPCQNGLFCGGTLCRHVMTRAGKEDFDCGGAGGDYLYVQLNGSASLTLSEVEIYALADADQELELQGSAHAAWKAGDQLMIASTSTDAEQTEQRMMTGKSAHGVTVSRPLLHEHSGCSASSDPCVMAAEVASLSRNIVLRGEEDCDPVCGHFMIAHTTQGFVCGAEFTNLGQTAKEGRYPLHVHLPGEAAELVVKGNSMHHNLNRGLVLHGVHNMTAESNICFRTKGHCFMTEDGVEQYNTFRNNLGVLPSALSFGCSHTHDKTFTCPHRSDDKPNAFWVANPNNFFIGNVGIVTGVAFNFETRHVMGLTRRMFPKEATKVGRNGKIKSSVPLAEFSSNVAHSSRMGVNNYPRMSLTPGGRNSYENFTAWRCGVGMSAHNSPRTSMPMIGARLYENTYGVRAGLPATRIEIIESHITAASDSSSVPLIINKFGKTDASKLGTVFMVDAYTRNWVRCHGGYTNGLFFSLFQDPSHDQPCPM
eukprot:TRINITY_DN29880_c0_g1_i1.p1 TRINITY_DN29880_c0_g1~~TRINITY_DN29880_c0_g1_i1.p1  ORF type:complete len:763 (+),score=122.18 TRINITY_DN29880_c0_g1_i1:188-2476(+)